MRSHYGTHDPMYRHPIIKALLVQLGAVAATPMALLALAYPAAAVLTLAALAALAWRQRAASPPERLAPRPRRQPTDHEHSRQVETPQESSLDRIPAHP